MSLGVAPFAHSYGGLCSSGSHFFGRQPSGEKESSGMNVYLCLPLKSSCMMLVYDELTVCLVALTGCIATFDRGGVHTHSLHSNSER